MRISTVRPCRRRDSLLRFDIGIFSLHFALTALFVVVPLQLVDVLGIPSTGHWRIYVPVVLAQQRKLMPPFDMFAPRT